MLHGHATTPNGTVPPTLDQASQNGPPAGMALVNGRQHGGNGNDNLTLGRRQTPAKTDPLVGNGRHFGRTVHAFCRIFPLIKDGMMRQIHLHSGITQAARLSEQVREQLRTGELIIPADCWPSFVYEEKYNPANPWEGLWRGDLLVKAFKHIFISPSSVEESARSTRAGNAQIHGMTAVTKPSLAYIASIVSNPLTPLSLQS
ncbi:hypothetical protein MD484_g316, partial [Candolleomyces efflorescens]